MSALSAAASDEDGDIISALRARVADLEAQLYAVGAGGVGKLEQPQSVTDCHQSQQKGEQEPLFWYRPRSDGMYEGPLHKSQIERVRKESGGWVPLYTHPQPKREPLTVGQINRLIADGKLPLSGNPYEVARAIERAYGIGGEA